MGVVLGVDVRFLQDDADDRGVGGDSGVGAEVLVVPVKVALGSLEDNVGGDGVPDSLVGEEDGVLSLNAVLARHVLLDLLDVVLPEHEHHALEVLGGASEPVLEAATSGATS